MTVLLQKCAFFVLFVVSQCHAVKVVQEESADTLTVRDLKISFLKGLSGDPDVIGDMMVPKENVDTLTAGDVKSKILDLSSDSLGESGMAKFLVGHNFETVWEDNVSFSSLSLVTALSATDDTLTVKVIRLQQVAWEFIPAAVIIRTDVNLRLEFPVDVTSRLDDLCLETFSKNVSGTTREGIRLSGRILYPDGDERDLTPDQLEMTLEKIRIQQRRDAPNFYLELSIQHLVNGEPVKAVREDVLSRKGWDKYYGRSEFETLNQEYLLEKLDRRSPLYKFFNSQSK